MRAGRVLAELLGVATRLGVSVRAEPFMKGVLEGRGGLCWIDGHAVIVMDEKMPVIDRVGVVATALASLDADGEGLTEHARGALDAAKRKLAPKRKRTAKRPGLARGKPRG